MQNFDFNEALKGIQAGKPDQKQPLVGRCKEAPHAHVYSFDRMTMKGCFLGVKNYLVD